MSGARTWAESRLDGIDWAVNLNTDDLTLVAPDNEFATYTCLVGGEIPNFLDRVGGSL